jgi:hypothetical protein
MSKTLTPMIPDGFFHVQNQALKNINYRLGRTEMPPKYYKDTVAGANGMAL